MSSPRKKALFKAINTAPVMPSSKDEPGCGAEEGFGRYVFGLSTMRKRLPKDVYRKLAKTIRDGERLNPEIADVVANAGRLVHGIDLLLREDWVFTGHRCPFYALKAAQWRAPRWKP